MATSKSRTKATGAAAGRRKQAASKPTKRKAAVKPTGAAPARLRKGRGRADAPAPEADEAGSDESAGSRASGKKLLVVESPTKSKTLTKFLGKDFLVLASNGAVMDLPKSQLGVDIDNQFEPEYVRIATKSG